MNINIDFYENVFGISCIENNLLALLRYHSDELHTMLYCESFVELRNVIVEAVNKKHDYLSYRGIKRLNDLSEEINLCKLQFHELSANFLLDLLETDTLTLPIMIQVNPEVLDLTSNTLPWRNDHFVLLYKKERDNIYVIDDYPVAMHCLSYEKLNECYMNVFVNFDINNNFAINERYLLKINQELSRIRELNRKKTIIEFNICELESLIHLRDALGIMRVSRNRTAEWLKMINKDCGVKFNPSAIYDIHSVVRKLDKLYSIIEYSRLRKKDNAGHIWEQLNEIVILDDEWRKNIIGC